ncbi:MAG: sugar transferase, partial [Sciscionella sp.]|nr:sugar transferase [Sciscionella sp.]
LGTPTADRDEVCGIPLLRLHQPGTRGGRVLKRAFDLVFGGLLAVLATPLLLVLAGTIRLTEHAPALFRQRRVVASGRTATMVKLRTVQGEPDPDRPQWTVEDGQCSRLGRWLRASHVDELPQLWNVLRGDMSLVGPRPERPFFADRFAEVIPGYRDRERMPAGLTGWAQVHGYYGDTSIVDRVRFDNAYIERASPWLDLVILARTLPAALSRRRKIVAQQGEQP